MTRSNGKKVFVGMSGGVDSSVSAALLKKAGYEVTGVFIKVWHPDWLPCEWKEERRDAMRVAAVLDIPFMTIDLEDEYKKGVVDYMLEEYKAGRTPNPDVMCNKEVKFGSFLKKALEMGADYIATGHYATITPSESKQGVRYLHEGADKNKDQSYFLWTLTQKELSHVVFPVGHLEKKEVRKLAQKFNIPTAEKKDSQGICFIGKVDMKEFLQHYLKEQPGDVVDQSGKIIGTHEGAVFYTLGQRHGFTINEKSSEDKPYYVIEKDIQKNTLTVSTKKVSEHIQNIRTVMLQDVNWISGTVPDISRTYGTRIRYRQEKQKCTLMTKENGTSEVRIVFEVPQEGVSPGQSVVLYDDGVCLGGGIIAALL